MDKEFTLRMLKGMLEELNPEELHSILPEWFNAAQQETEFDKFAIREWLRENKATPADVFPLSSLISYCRQVTKEFEVGTVSPIEHYRTSDPVTQRSIRHTSNSTRLFPKFKEYDILLDRLDVEYHASSASGYNIEELEFVLVIRNSMKDQRLEDLIDERAKEVAMRNWGVSLNGYRIVSCDGQGVL